MLFWVCIAVFHGGLSPPITRAWLSIVIGRQASRSGLFFASIFSSDMSAPRTILILEDNDDRITDFTKAVKQLGDGFEVQFWRDAHSMCKECERLFPTATLVSLDHD